MLPEPPEDHRETPLRSADLAEPEAPPSEPTDVPAEQVKP
jgi:hypothetical protein